MALNNKKPARDVFEHVVHYIAVAFTFDDNGKVLTIGTIPANAQIIKPLSGVTVNTVFNAGTSNVADIGTTADDDLYGTDLALGTVAFVPVDEVVSYRVTSDTTFTLTVALSGTAATTGAGVAQIAYLPRVA
jgi:hypothetical protein